MLVFALCACNSKCLKLKHPSSKTTKKGIIPTSDDHFVQEDWGEFQDKHFFSQVELSKLLLKAFGLQKRPISYPFLGDQWKSLHLWSGNVMRTRWCAVQNKGSTLNSLQLTKFIQHGFSCYTVICIHHAVESLFSFVPCVINSFRLITQCTLINAAYVLHSLCL